MLRRQRIRAGGVFRFSRLVANTIAAVVRPGLHGPTEINSGAVRRRTHVQKHVLLRLSLLAELIEEPGAQRARELLRDLEAWVDGGLVPASAKRYSALLRATDRVEPGYTSAGADAAEAAIVAEYCSITFATTLTGLLECAAGDFSHEKPDHLLTWFAEDISSLPANDNALRLKHLIKACA